MRYGCRAWIDSLCSESLNEAEGSVSILPAHMRRFATSDGIELLHKVPWSPPRPSSLCRAFSAHSFFGGVPRAALWPQAAYACPRLICNAPSALAAPRQFCCRADNETCLRSARLAQRKVGAVKARQKFDRTEGERGALCITSTAPGVANRSVCAGRMPTLPFASLKVTPGRQ